MEPESLKQLKEKYNHLLEKLKEYDDIYSELVQDSRNRDKGNFGFLDERPDLKHGWYLRMLLQSSLFSLYLVIEKKENINGECGVKCIGCSANYDHESKKWSCQVTCECK